MQCGLKSQLACIYICAQLTSHLGMQLNLWLRVIGTGTPGGHARVQDGVLTSYMDAAFVVLTPEMWTNQSLLFTQLLQLQRD